MWTNDEVHQLTQVGGQHLHLIFHFNKDRSATVKISHSSASKTVALKNILLLRYRNIVKKRLSGF